MRTLLVSFFLLAASGRLAHADDDAVVKELKALAGSWKLVAVEVDGKPILKDDLPAISFTLHPDGKSDVQSPDGKFQTKSVIDPAKKPKTLDIEYLGGPLKGQKQYGIYKTDGDRFTVDDFDAAMSRAAEMKVQVVLPRHRNPPDGNGGPNHWECWLRDLDGYIVVLASPDGSADGNWRP